MDNRRIPNDEIPAQLIEATIEMARYLVAQDRTLERPQDGLSEIKADVVTIRFKPDYYLPVIPSDISYIIRGLGSIASGQVSFSKIRRA